MKLTKTLLEELVREAVKKKFSKQQHKIRRYVNKLKNEKEIEEDVWRLARRSIYKDPSGKSALEIVKKALAQKKGQPAQQQPQQKQAVKPGGSQQPAAPQGPPEEKHAPAVQKQQSREDAIYKASNIEKDPYADPKVKKRMQLNLDRMAQILSARRRRKLLRDPKTRNNDKLVNAAKDSVLKMLMRFTFDEKWIPKTGLQGLNQQQRKDFIKIVGWNPWEKK